MGRFAKGAWTGWLVLSVVACGASGETAPTGYPAAYPPPAPRNGPPPSSHTMASFAPRAGIAPAALPAGWAWPFDVNRLVTSVVTPQPNVIQFWNQLATAATVYRPVNVAALQAKRAQNPGACGPVEIAPNVWITPLCQPVELGRTAGNTNVPIPTYRGPLPASVSLQALGLDGPTKNQQMAPVCWSFAMSGVMENALRRAGKNDVVAPLHLISNDEWRVIKMNQTTHAIAFEPNWGFDPVKACEEIHPPHYDTSCQTAYGIEPGSGIHDPTLVAEKSRADATAQYRIGSVKGLSSKPGNPDQLASVVATGQAVFIEIEIAHSWSNQYGKDVMPDWQPDGIGGHAVVLTGYKVVNGRRMFQLHNSWGASWGENGYAYVSEEMIRSRVNDAFIVTLVDKAGNAISPNASPVPVPVPTIPTLPSGFPTIPIPSTWPTQPTQPTQPLPTFPPGWPQLPMNSR